MTTITLDDALQARIRAVAAPEEDFQDFIAAAALELVARRERRADGAPGRPRGSAGDPERPDQAARPRGDLPQVSGEVWPARSFRT